MKTSRILGGIAAGMLSLALVACSGTTDADNEGSSNEVTQEATEEQSSFDLAVGETVESDSGLAVTVNSVDTSLVNYDGSPIVAVNVTYTNNGDETANYNPYDWKGETDQGAQEYTTYYSESSEELNSGSLAAGGTVTGNLYFEGGTVKVLYYGNVLDNEPTASWILS